MPNNHTVARALNDLGLAAWFGGSLMGAVGLNAAAAKVSDPSERARAAGEGWMRWAPVNAAAIGATLVGGALLLKGNKGRLASQRGVGGLAVTKTVLIGAALASTAGSGYFGSKVARAGDVEVEGATEPSAATPDDIASAQRMLKVLQWTTPALTAAVIVVDAKLGEQQRPLSVLAGVAGRARRVPKRARQVKKTLDHLPTPHLASHLPTPSTQTIADAVQKIVPDQLVDAVR